MLTIFKDLRASLVLEVRSVSFWATLMGSKNVIFHEVSILLLKINHKNVAKHKIVND